MSILDVNECSQQNSTHKCHSNASYQNTDVAGVTPIWISGQWIQLFR